MSAEPKKERRLDLRLSALAKTQIEKAAELQGRSISDFVLAGLELLESQAHRFDHQAGLGPLPEDLAIGIEQLSRHARDHQTRLFIADLHTLIKRASVRPVAIVLLHTEEDSCTRITFTVEPNGKLPTLTISLAANGPPETGIGSPPFTV